MTEAEDLRAQADKLESTKGGFFSKLFGGGDKLEEACDLYTRAGSRFKGSLYILFGKRGSIRVTIDKL